MPTRRSLPSLQTVSTIISPGNSFDPGIATTRSILGSLGRRIANGAEGRPVRGWQGLSRRVLPGLGARWIGHCDAPDRELFPQRYAGLKTADVYAALEVGAFHLGLWALSGLVRAGLIRNPEKLAGPLVAMKRKLGFLGSDRGGMLVTHGRHGPRRRAQADRLAPGRRQRARTLYSRDRRRCCWPSACSTARCRRAAPCRASGCLRSDEFLAEIGDLDIAAGMA